LVAIGGSLSEVTPSTRNSEDGARSSLNASSNTLAPSLTVPAHYLHLALVQATSRSKIENDGRVRFGSRIGREVSLDCILPHAQRQKDMRRHVQRVRCGRFERGIAARCGKAPRRDRRIIITVNKQMSYSRVVRQCRRELLEDRGRLELRRHGFGAFQTSTLATSKGKSKEIPQAAGHLDHVSQEAQMAGF
jgi:hypothetical protein